MKKKRLANIALLIVSISTTLVLAELLFRFILFSDSEKFESLRDPSAYTLYFKDHNEDLFTDEYWKLSYKFRSSHSIENPQPLLGWWGLFNRETLEHINQEDIQGRRPVLLYGDSFARCVDSVLCFEDIMNSDTIFSSRYYLLNYGVGGFGVDQIGLLFEETVERFDNPFVIFSMLTTDLDRSMLSFRDFQKPYYKVSGDQLILDGVPITQSTDEYIKQNPPEIGSYLLNRLRNSKINPFKQSERRYEAYLDEIQQLNAFILTKVFDTLENLGLDYVILIFHPEHHSLPDWRLTFLQTFCEMNGIPSICDLDIRKKDSTSLHYDPHRYAIKGDGHPTSYLNELIARDLMRIIIEAE